MRRESWPCSGPEGYMCGVCQARNGQQHRRGCVNRRRTVVVKVTVELVIDVPEDADEYDIEEKADCNLLTAIGELEERLFEEGHCSCNFMETKYLREATAEDERLQRLSIDKVE